ncbi:MAG: lipid-binding SYLF domain-containing protein [Pseudomonadota bacterium]
MKRAGSGIIAIMALVAGLLSVTAVAQTSDVKVQNVVGIFQDSEVTHPYFEHAYGYAVFPTVGKGGFIVGGAYGTGKVFRQGELAGLSSLTQLSIGFQAGLQAYSEIIFFQDERAYSEFISGTFEFDATASAVAVTAGAQAQTGTMGASAGYSAGPKTSRQQLGAYYKGLAVFTHAKGGLMLEASVAGQKFNFKPQQFRSAAR